MNTEETIEKRLEQLAQAIGSDESMVEKVITHINAEPIAEFNQIRRRLIMNRFTKLAAAAVIIVAVALSINIWVKSIPTAYAIDQTISANHTVRYLHIRDFDSQHENEPKEFWFECDKLGQIKNARWHMPEWDAPEDGEKVIVWKQDNVQIWFKKKNALTTVRDKDAVAGMLVWIKTCDPRLAVDRIYEQVSQDKVNVEIDEPSDKASPIVITATYLPESSSPKRREVLYIDRDTKLVTAIEYYWLKDGEYEYQGRQEHYYYNIPIDPTIFDLDNELPSDVVRIDQATQEVGLIQGKLSDEEVVVEVARQFMKALINKDYAKAGKLEGGIPAYKIQEWYGDLNIVRIISIGEPRPHPEPEVGGFLVSYKFEFVREGQIIEKELPGLAIRQVYKQPGHWQIHGGTP